MLAGLTRTEIAGLRRVPNACHANLAGLPPGWVSQLRVVLCLQGKARRGRKRSCESSSRGRPGRWAGIWFPSWELSWEPRYASWREGFRAWVSE